MFLWKTSFTRIRLNFIGRKEYELRTGNNHLYYCQICFEIIWPYLKSSRSHLLSSRFGTIQSVWRISNYDVKGMFVKTTVMIGGLCVWWTAVFLGFVAQKVQMWCIVAWWYFHGCEGMLCAVTSEANIQVRNVDPNVISRFLLSHNDCVIFTWLISCMT